MRFAPILIGTILLAACGGEQDEQAGGRSSAESYAVNEKDGVVTARVRSQDGTATMESGTGVEAKLPAGFGMMPGARVLSASNITGDQGSGSMVLFETDRPVAEVIAHYRRQAEAAGVKIQIEMNTNGTEMIGGEGGGLTFSLTASRSDDLTSGQLTVGSS